MIKSGGSTAFSRPHLWACNTLKHPNNCQKKRERIKMLDFSGYGPNFSHLHICSIFLSYSWLLEFLENCAFEIDIIHAGWIQAIKWARDQLPRRFFFVSPSAFSPPLSSFPFSSSSSSLSSQSVSHPTIGHGAHDGVAADATAAAAVWNSGT